MAQAASTNRKFDVFLSFRGEDTRKTLVDHLYRRLSDARINVFLDNERLEKGEDIGYSLEAAIRNSDILIPIFSKRYADSPWCLKEASHMTNAAGKIIPIFFDVQPSDVRYQKTGTFQLAFEKHRNNGRNGPHEIEEWRKALKSACSHSGWSLEDDCNGYHGLLVDLVTEKIVNMLPRTLDVGKYQVGIEERTRKVIDLLNIESGAGVITLGICGIGGIGKTTLAKSVFNNISSKFGTFSCFLPDIRRSTKTEEWQMKIIESLVNQKVRIISPDEGNVFMRRHLRAVKALVVLDDVDDSHVLEHLRGDWFGPGSRIIVTTRNEGVMDIKGRNDRLYRVEELDDDQARTLFCWHAFCGARPDIEYRDLSETIIKACKGLPLTLSVIGAHLRDNPDKKIWQEAVRRLESLEFDGIEERLIISYNALNPTAKAMFLDIACFFLGLEQGKALSIWEAFGWAATSTMNDLLRRCLINLTSDGRLGMHDILRDMGRTIVRKEDISPGKHSRLWDENAARRVLQRSLGTESIQGVLYHPKMKETLKTSSFEPMHNLRLLSLSDVILDGDFRNVPQNLRWLRWTLCSLDCLPPGLKMADIAVLELTDSSISQVWDEAHSDLEVPKELKHLNLNGCESLTSLPDSIGFLTKLEELDLSNCKKLQGLPHTVSNLTSLQKIFVSCCESLGELPEGLGKLTSVKELRLDNTPIVSMPDFFGDPGRPFYLKKLSLRKCTKLERLPKSIGMLQGLRFVDMDGSGVGTLPEEFGQLGGLEELRLSDCQQLMKLPESFGDLGMLSILKLNDNPKLTSLPESFSHLEALRILEARNCGLSDNGIPQQIGMLTSLEDLDLRCNKFHTLPGSFKDLRRLTRLMLNDCADLSELPLLPSSLVEVDLSNCVRLKSVSHLSSLEKLKTLVFHNCEQLTAVPGLRSVQSLTNLDLTGCGNIERGFFEGLYELKHLERLYLSGSKVSVFNFDKGMPVLRELVLRADAIPDWFDYQMETQVLGEEHANRTFVEVNVTFKKNVRCTGVMFCFISHDQGWSRYSPGGYSQATSIEASIIREGSEVLRIPVAMNKFVEGRDELHLFICRENHRFMKELASGDRIHVWARSLYPGWRIWVKQGGVHLLYARDEADTQPPVSQRRMEESVDSIYRRLFKDLGWLQCIPVSWNLNMNFVAALDLANCFIDRQIATFCVSIPWDDRLGLMRMVHTRKETMDMRLKTQEWFELEEEQLLVKNAGHHFLGWTNESGSHSRLVWGERLENGDDGGMKIAFHGRSEGTECDLFVGILWADYVRRGGFMNAICHGFPEYSVPSASNVCLTEVGVGVRRSRGDTKVKKRLIRNFENASFVQMDGWDRNGEWCCRYYVPPLTQHSFSGPQELMPSTFIQKLTIDFPWFLSSIVAEEDKHWTQRREDSVQWRRLSVARGSKSDLRDHFFFLAKFTVEPPPPSSSPTSTGAEVPDTMVADVGTEVLDTVVADVGTEMDGKDSLGIKVITLLGKLLESLNLKCW